MPNEPASAPAPAEPVPEPVSEASPAPAVEASTVPTEPASSAPQHMAPQSTMPVQNVQGASPAATMQAPEIDAPVMDTPPMHAEQGAVAEAAAMVAETAMVAPQEMPQQAPGMNSVPAEQQMAPANEPASTETDLSSNELVDIRGLAQEVVDTLKPEAEALPGNTEAAPTEEVVTIAPVQPIAYEQLDPDNWFDLYRQLDFSGVLQATASNCALAQRDEKGLAFVLDEHNNHLYDNAHKQRMADIFSEYFGRPVQVQIVQGNATDVTPAAIIARLKAQRQAEALAAIETDPTIIQLIEEFDAKLIADSVVPLGPDPLKT